MRRSIFVTCKNQKQKQNLNWWTGNMQKPRETLFFFFFFFYSFSFFSLSSYGRCRNEHIIYQKVVLTSRPIFVIATKLESRLMHQKHANTEVEVFYIFHWIVCFSFIFFFSFLLFPFLLVLFLWANPPARSPHFCLFFVHFFFWPNSASRGGLLLFRCFIFFLVSQ